MFRKHGHLKNEAPALSGSTNFQSLPLRPEAGKSPQNVTNMPPKSPPKRLTGGPTGRQNGSRGPPRRPPRRPLAGLGPPRPHMERLGVPLGVAFGVPKWLKSVQKSTPKIRRHWKSLLEPPGTDFDSIWEPFRPAFSTPGAKARKSENHAPA